MDGRRCWEALCEEAERLDCFQVLMRKQVGDACIKLEGVAAELPLHAKVKHGLGLLELTSLEALLEALENLGHFRWGTVPRIEEEDG